MNDYQLQIRELRAINAQMTRHRDELASVLRALVDALDSEAGLTMSKTLAKAWSEGRQALYGGPS